MLVPVDTVPVPVPYCMPEMKVEVQDIEAVVPSQCSTVEVPFNYILPQRARQGLELSKKVQHLRAAEWSRVGRVLCLPVSCPLPYPGGPRSLASGRRKPPVTRSPRGIAMFHTNRQESGNTWSMRTNTRSRFSR